MGTSLYWRFSPRVFVYMLIAFPMTVPAFLMFLTLGGFRFPYSVFGPYKRTPLPREEPVVADKTMRGRVGLVWWGLGGTSAFVWAVYSSGLGIRIPWCGKAFIPFELFRSLRRQRVKSGYRLVHDSPEVRNPVYIPSRKVVKGIQQIMSERCENGSGERLGSRSREAGGRDAECD
jgi:hypothetical protein